MRAILRWIIGVLAVVMSALTSIVTVLTVLDFAFDAPPWLRDSAGFAITAFQEGVLSPIAGLFGSGAPPVVELPTTPSVEPIAPTSAFGVIIAALLFVAQFVFIWFIWPRIDTSDPEYRDFKRRLDDSRSAIPPGQQPH